MSSTVKFTPLHRPDSEYLGVGRNSQEGGVRILDREGLMDALSESLVEQMETRTFTDRAEYPRREWDVLVGFATWDEANHHNISNTGGKDFAHLLATISEYTEPFVVYATSGPSGGWPHAAEIAHGDEHRGTVLRFEAENGTATMTEVTLTVDDETVEEEVREP